MPMGINITVKKIYMAPEIWEFLQVAIKNDFPKMKMKKKNPKNGRFLGIGKDQIWER
jgi:hypothetical protein